MPGRVDGLPAGLMPMAAEDDAGFLSRWSRRKTIARRSPPEAEVPLPAPPGPAVVGVAGATGGGDGPAPGKADLPVPAGEPGKPVVPPPTMDDVAQLTHDSDYSRFVAGNVDPGVKQAAMKKLFSDPHFNVMDRLDVYIDDYSQPDPLPPGMLRQMAQSRMLGLFDAEEDAEADAEAVTGVTGVTIEPGAGQGGGAAPRQPLPDDASPALPPSPATTPSPAPAPSPALDAGAASDAGVRLPDVPGSAPRVG